MSSLTKNSIEPLEEPLFDDRYTAEKDSAEALIWESSRLDTSQFLTTLRSEQKALARTSEHYRQIGQALSIAESVSWKVGIIKLFPTRRVLALRQAYSGPLETFLRESLSTVPTTTLEFYVEDLDNMTDEASSLENLSISPLTFIERAGVLLLFAPFIFLLSVVSFSSKFPVDEGAGLLLTAAVALPTLLYLGIVYILTSNTYRRASFSIVLGWEILRRKGGDNPGAPGFRICDFRSAIHSKAS